jgi:hypothetical protein
MIIISVRAQRDETQIFTYAGRGLRHGGSRRRGDLSRLWWRLWSSVARLHHRLLGYGLRLLRRRVRRRLLAIGRRRLVLLRRRRRGWREGGWRRTPRGWRVGGWRTSRWGGV